MTSYDTGAEMKNTRSGPNTVGLLNTAIIALSIGVTWSLVIIARAVFKNTSGEIGNSLLAGCGLGIGFALLYFWSVARSATVDKRHKVMATACAIGTSIGMAISFHYIGIGLAS